jgi:hypothetical protein
LHNATLKDVRASVLVALKAEFPLFSSLSLVQPGTLKDGTLTATEAFVKNTVLLFAVLAMLAAAAAGCSKSNSADENSVVKTNSPAEESASNAWQDTKGAATNAWNATKDAATNVWHKTTNAIH